MLDILGITTLIVHAIGRKLVALMQVAVMVRLQIVVLE